MTKKKYSKKVFLETMRRLGPVIDPDRVEAFLLGWKRFHGKLPTEAEANLLINWLTSIAISEGLVQSVELNEIDVAGISDSGEPMFGLNENGKQRAEAMMDQVKRSKP